MKLRLLSDKSMSAFILSIKILYSPYFIVELGIFKYPEDLIFFLLPTIDRSASMFPVPLSVFKSFIPKDFAILSSRFIILFIPAFETKRKSISGFFPVLMLPFKEVISSKICDV